MLSSLAHTDEGDDAQSHSHPAAAIHGRSLATYYTSPHPIIMPKMARNVGSYSFNNLIEKVSIQTGEVPIDNLVEGEQAVGLSDALMDRAAEEGTENNSEGTFQVYQSRKKKHKDRESLEGNGDNSIALINKRPRDAAPDAESTAEEDPQPMDKTKATGERKRLYFSNSCGLTLSQKRLWSAKLAQQYRSFKPTLKEGLNRPFITVEGTEAVATLTTEGYDGVVMEQPKDTGNFTKVFIVPYDCLLDPELLLDDDRVVWAKRHVVRGEKKKSVVALVRGEVPEKLHIS
ncbi:hypothetical protein Pcinc_003479 [Petrolisthes cinctipes]|uniref:Uncharacterized protein n=1 Tax=Petrolisthes cinctipes TaxID=88211 RepID=A0AAE1L2G9_PETCI|nr:hypothetical protein Pcinc_003479 [Petrolisthes cinctipes]